MQKVIAEKDLVNLRRRIHSEPELSAAEYKTVDILLGFLSKHKPQEIIKKVGGQSLITVFNSFNEGPCILFRVELDALPIAEENSFSYRSKNTGIAHLCGHDGHMATLLGLSALLSENRIKKGKVALLFQSAEETGAGAKQVLNSHELKELNPDYIFSFHNVPGFGKANIIIKDGVFAFASKALTIKLFGKSSHASDENAGINPAFAMSRIILKLNDERNNLGSSVSVIYANLGNKSFGTNASSAEIGITLRNKSDEKLVEFSNKIELLISDICKEEGLIFDFNYSEEFPSLVNDKECNKIIAKAADNVDVPLVNIDNAFRWSEDFAYFTKEYKAAMFGIGAGENHEPLHSSTYDFPDEILNDSVRVLFEIVKDFDMN